MIRWDIHASADTPGCADMQAGLDSLGAVDLCNAIGIRFGIDLPATAAFDYPTAAALAALINANMAPTQVWHVTLPVMSTGDKAVYRVTYQHVGCSC